MLYLKSAHAHIANVEKAGTIRHKLTSLQKNRIALKYIKFRENQKLRERSSPDQPSSLVDVTGGYD